MAEEANEDGRYSNKPLCVHSNILEECPHCDFDFRQEVDSTILDSVSEDDLLGFFSDTLDRID